MTSQWGHYKLSKLMHQGIKKNGRGHYFEAWSNHNRTARNTFYRLMCWHILALSNQDLKPCCVYAKIISRNVSPTTNFMNNRGCIIWYRQQELWAPRNKWSSQEQDLATQYYLSLSIEKLSIARICMSACPSFLSSQNSSCYLFPSDFF